MGRKSGGAIRDTLARMQNAEVTVEWLGMSAAGNVAWSAAMVTIENTVDGVRVLTPYYQTAICEKKVVLRGVSCRCTSRGPLRSPIRLRNALVFTELV
ncbi:MAG: hypothetical protein ACXV5P_09810 [Halobacteriota archaeon]